MQHRSNQELTRACDPGAVLPQPGDEALQPDLRCGHAAEHGGAGAGRPRRVADQAGHRAALQHEAPPVAGGHSN